MTRGRNLFIGLALMGSCALMGLCPTTARAQQARLSLFARADFGDHTFFVGSPIELEVSIVNQTIEELDATALAAWREGVEQQSLSGTLSAGFPMRPSPSVTTPDLEIELGDSSLQWFEDARIELRTADGTSVEADLSGRSLLSPVTAERDGPTRLGRDPEFALLDISATLTMNCAPGRYVFRVESPRWGTAELPIEVRLPNGPRELGMQARNRAARSLRFGAVSDAVEHAQNSLALEPEHPDGLFLLGIAQEQAGNLDAAITALTKYRQQVEEGGLRACFQSRIAEHARLRVMTAGAKAKAKSHLATTGSIDPSSLNPPNLDGDER